MLDCTQDGLIIVIVLLQYVSATTRLILVASHFKIIGGIGVDQDWCAGKGQPSWQEQPASVKMFPKRHQMDGVVYPVPGLDDVGLGIEFNEEYVLCASLMVRTAIVHTKRTYLCIGIRYAIQLEKEQEGAFEYSSPPFLRRRDGSWTNW